MQGIRVAFLVLILLSCFTASGLSQDQHNSPAPADMAMMQGMGRMQHAMAAAPMTGNPDQDFVAMMIPHHQGAVSMAQVELRYGSDPAMRALATRIIAAQKHEVARMRAWQAAHPSNRPN